MDQSSRRKRKLLLIALHFPPYTASSGYLRTLKFCEHLPSYGWQPIVLTADSKAHSGRSVAGDEGEVTPDILVERAFAFDSARQLAVRGRYPGFLALPDRWVSWWPHAVLKGLRIIREQQPDAIFTTYPVATAHLIGLTLQRLTGIPWVADFRDPMLDSHYPRGRVVRRIWRSLEARTLLRCSAAVFTTPSARALYANRYPSVSDRRLSVVLNGFDESDFQGQAVSCRTGTTAPKVLIHSGVLYRDVRDPRGLYTALKLLREEGVVSSETLRVVLRACGPEQYHQDLIDAFGIGDIVSLAPSVPYHESLREMMEADGLLLFQGREANKQVPAKLFEYLRAGKPILALVDREGDSARILRENDVGLLASMEDAREIAGVLRRFMSGTSDGGNWAATREVANHYSRRASTSALVDVLDSVSTDGANE